MTKSPHLILLTTDFKPNLGGISQYLHHLWDELSQYTSTTVISIVPYQDKKLSHRYELKILSSSLLNKNKTNSIVKTWQLLRDFHPQREIMPFIESLSGQPLEIFIGVWHPLSHIWCEALQRANLPYSFFIYGQELITSQYRSWASKRSSDLKGAKQVYACSEATAELAKVVTTYHLGTQIIYPGITSPENSLSIETKAGIYRKELQLTGGPIVLSLCRLIHRKGIDLVLESFTGLREKFPDLKYIVAGDGEEKEKLQQRTIDLKIDDQVIFLGAVDEETKTVLFALCDLFVMPVRDEPDNWEGFGMCFLEAAIAGKAAIGGKTGGVIEAIEEGVTGYLVNTDNATQTGRAMKKLLGDGDLRRRMGEAARKRAENFTWANSAARLWGMIQ